MYNGETVKEMLVDFVETEKDIVSQTERLQRMEMRLRNSGIPENSEIPDESVKDLNHEQKRMKSDLERDIQRSILKHRKQREYFEMILNSIRNSDEAAVIRARYFDGSGWYGVNDLIFGARKDYLEKEDSYMRRIYALHRLALADMAERMEENPPPADWEEAQE